MITKAEAKRLVHLTTVKSLRGRTASKLFQGNYSDNDFKKLDVAMEELAAFIEKRGKLEEANKETNISDGVVPNPDVDDNSGDNAVG